MLWHNKTWKYVLTSSKSWAATNETGSDRSSFIFQISTVRKDLRPGKGRRVYMLILFKLPIPDNEERKNSNSFKSINFRSVSTNGLVSEYPERHLLPPAKDSGTKLFLANILITYNFQASLYMICAICTSVSFCVEKKPGRMIIRFVWAWHGLSPQILLHFSYIRI